MLNRLVKLKGTEDNLIIGHVYKDNPLHKECKVSCYQFNNIDNEWDEMGVYEWFNYDELEILIIQ